jgi:hypothetical protein
MIAKVYEANPRIAVRTKNFINYLNLFGVLTLYYYQSLSYIVLKLFTQFNSIISCDFKFKSNSFKFNVIFILYLSSN